MSKNKIAILLGVVCVVLTIAICVQIKTITYVNSNITSSFAEDKLRDEVLKWKENYDRKNEELKQAEKLLEITRTRASENNSGSANMAEELNMANRQIGLTNLKGKGLIITLDDNKTQASEVQDRWFKMGIYCSRWRFKRGCK